MRDKFKALNLGSKVKGPIQILVGEVVVNAIFLGVAKVIGLSQQVRDWGVVIVFVAVLFALLLLYLLRSRPQPSPTANAIDDHDQLGRQIKSWLEDSGRPVSISTENQGRHFDFGFYNEGLPVSVYLQRTGPESHWLMIVCGYEFDPSAKERYAKLCTDPKSTFMEDVKRDIILLGLEFEGFSYPLSGPTLFKARLIPDNSLTRQDFVDCVSRVFSAYALFESDWRRREVALGLPKTTLGGKVVIRDIGRTE